MKKMAKRLLAVALSAALLIGCSVSGLMLPVMAEEAAQTQATTQEVFNLFPDGDFESGTVDYGLEVRDGVGLGGSKALVIPPNTSNKKMKTVTLRQKLVPGGAYVIRYKVKSLNHSVYWTDPACINGSLPATNYQETDKFIQYQYMFTPATETDQFTQFGLYNTHATKEAYIDEFEIYEYKPGLNIYPSDTREDVAALAVTMVTNKDKDTGEFTIYPGGVFSPFVKGGITVTDAQDGNNNVIKFSGLNATDGNEAVLPLASLCYNKSVFDVNRDVIISFRYKSENDAATVRISAANSDVCKVNGKPTTTAPDENGWRTHTARIKLHKISLSGTARLHFSGATEVLIDDFYCAQGTGLELSDLMWNPNGVQLQSGTELQFSVNLSNKSTVDLEDYRDVAVNFVARNGDKTVDLGTMVQKGGMKAGDSVTLTLPTKWTPPVGEWVVSAHVATTYLEGRENIGAQGHFRVEETRLQAPPEALAGGYDTLTFSDEFDFANVDTEYTGAYGYKWYLTDLSGVCGDKDDYSIANGVMTLAGDNMRYNWLMATMDGYTAAGWHGFQYGYLEYRTRFDSVPEGWSFGTDYSHISDAGMPNAPAVWSFPPEVICSSKLGYAERYVEMDWMEYWGYDKNNCQWTITLHDQYRMNNANQTTINSINNRGSNHIMDPKNNIGDGEWHTVGYRWEKGLLIAYLDGREIFYQDWSENGHYPEGIAAQGEMTADAFTPLDNQLSPLILAGSEGWPFEIDYIRVWQKSEQDPHAYPVVDNETQVEALHWSAGVSSATPLTGDDTLYWHSSNSTIASVANGVIATHHEGKAVITAYRGKKAVQQYVVTVDRYGEKIPFGNFELAYNDDHKALNGNGTDYGLVVDGKGSIVTESDGNRALMLPVNKSGYLHGLKLEWGKSYRLTGRVKGTAGLPLIGFYHANSYDSNSYTGEKNPVVTGKQGQWVEFSYTFTTTAFDSTTGAPKCESSYTVSLRNSSVKDGNGNVTLASAIPAYFDDLSLVEIDGLLVQGSSTAMSIVTNTKQSLFYMCFDSSLNYSDYSITFTSSSNTSVLRRSSSSKLTARACGTSNVTVKATPTAGGTALTKTIKFTVVDGRKLALSNSAVNLLKGDTKTLQASVTSGTLGTVTYSSDNTAVATVDQNGKVTAVSEGLATITATTADALVATCDVVVQNRPTVAIEETATNVWVGESVDLTVAATPGAEITWTSNDNAVATVADGVVTTHAAGVATITASVYGGATDTFTITATQKPTITIAEQNINLYCEQTKTLTTTVNPQGSAIVWKSSDNSIATVANGVVTAQKAGVATITATVDGGNYATCVVNVANKPTINLSQSTANVWTGETVNLSATVNPVGTAVTWTSNNNAVATVQNGVVTTHKAGTATITATVDGGNYATCVVNVTDKPTISLDKATANVWTGETVNLSATVNPVGTAVTWTSNNNAVATVQNGVVTTHKAGTATITATVNGGNYATCVVNVTDKPTISLDKATANVWTGESVTLQATVTPQGTAVVWASNNNAVATVQNGVVTTHKAGTATITATVDGGNYATCVVNVTDKPTISLDKATANVWTGENVTLQATVTPQGTAIVWKSSDDSIATVQNGVVTTHKAGTATITATVNGGNYASCVVTATDKPTVSLAVTTATLWLGETATLVATVTPQSTAVVWTSNNSEVATVADGVVTAHKAGVATITATVNGGNFATCLVTVQNPTISLSQSTANVWLGESVTLSAMVNPQGTAVVWSSNNTAVATVQNGVVTTHKAGTATITATVNGGNFATCEVTVQNPTISLSQSTANVWTGEGVTLSAVVTPQGTAVEWSSNNTAVATVQNGVVTTHKAGTATITATVNGGNYASCVVNVTDKPTISLSQTTADVWTGESVTLSATVNPQGTAVMWSSNNTAVATVADGVVTTHAAGTATITATVNGGNFATCVVTVTDKPQIKSFDLSMKGFGLHFPKDVTAIKANVDGIRFGAKLDFGAGYTTKNDVLYLPYDNEYYEVVSMGAILRRHEDGTELTVENARWTSEAYNNQENKLRCIESAENYVVFAVNMMTKEPSAAFNARQYDARGYVQLNIDGVVTTIYTDMVTDSVDEAFKRAFEFEIIPGEDDVYDDFD